jgi:hypothetical protein
MHEAEDYLTYQRPGSMAACLDEGLGICRIPAKLYFYSQIYALT